MSIDKAVDSAQLDSDLTSVANAIRTKGGTSAQLAFPNGFVQAIGDIPTGGTLITKTITENGTYSAEDDDADGYSEVTVNVSGVTQYPYYLGGYGQMNPIITARDNHVRMDFTDRVSGASPGLRDFHNTNINETWFTINAGDTYEIEFYNVVNPSNRNWNANAKKAGTNTSLSYGIGNGTHLDGVIVSGTRVSTEDIGCLFVYILDATNGDYLEFDMSIKINGTRIL